MEVRAYVFAEWQAGASDDKGQVLAHSDLR
jgi:hypothetical protein